MDVITDPVSHVFEGPEGEEGGEVGRVLQGQDVHHGGMLDVTALAPLVNMAQYLVALVPCKKSSMPVALRED